MQQRKKLGFCLFVFLIIFVLAACSQDPSKEAQTKKNSSKDHENSNLSEPKYGGTHTILEAAGALTLDPHASASIYTHNIIGLAYSKLVAYETGPDVKYTEYKIVPELAEEWDISEDGKVYTFKLRDVKWHDKAPVNGRALDAEDVAATMNRIIELPGQQAPMLSKVEKVEAKDEKTVVFTLKEPFAPFLNFMAHHSMWILPKEGVDGEFDLSTTVIGTGPFMLENWKEDVKAELVRNPNYYEEGKPYIEKIDYLITPNQSARVAAFRTGQADAIGNVEPEDAQNIIKTNPDAVIMENLHPTQIQIAMNMEREEFKDLRVRKAISLAIDRLNAVGSIYGTGEVSSPVNPTLSEWVLPKEEREELQPFNQEEAKKLLKEAGYEKGFDTTIMISSAYGDGMARMAQWIAEDLRAIGINAELKVEEHATYFSEKFPNKDYDIAVGFQTYFLEPDEWLYTQLHSEGSRNWFGIEDSKLDEMLEEQRSAMDIDERKQQVLEIQRYALENVVNPIPLTTHYMLTPMQPWVKNVHPHASYGLTHLKNVWLDK